MMVDARINARTSRRRTWKRWSLPALATGGGVVAAISGYRPVAALLSLAEDPLLAAGITDPQHWLAGHPWLLALGNWIAAPAVFGFLVFGITSRDWFQALIDRCFPDPPAFVRTDIDALRSASMILIDPAVAPFVGRDAERAELDALLAPSSDAFRWQLVLGQSGIGKSRTALEWLDAARSRGWDFGLVARSARELIPGWSPRRSTALVIDDASAEWGADLAGVIRDLAQRATPKRPLRLLVLDQVVPALGGFPVERDTLNACRLPPMLLRALPDDHVRAMLGSRVAAKDLERLVARSAGRPRAAILLAKDPMAQDYVDALRRWSELNFPELQTESGTPARDVAIPLILAALAGPISSDRARALLIGQGALNLGSLLRYFEGASGEDLARELPALQPDHVAHDLALRLLARLDRPDRDRVGQNLVDLDPDRLQASLGTLWRDRPDLLDGGGNSEAPAKVLRWLQTLFDDVHPDRVAAFFADLNENLEALKACSAPIQAERLFDLLLAKVETRPFDPAIRSTELVAISTVAHVFGQAGCWAKFEEVAARLEELSGKRDVKHEDVARTRACISTCALNHYGDAGLIDDVRRWDKYFMAIVGDPHLVQDDTIAFALASGAGNAMKCYRSKETLQDFDRWDRHLSRLIDNPSFARSFAVKHRAALSVVNTVEHYGGMQRWDDLERWGDRVIFLTHDSSFQEEPSLRLAEAIFASNVMMEYGDNRRWQDLERWGERLLALAHDPRFSDVLEIRRWEAEGALSAMGNYGLAQQWDDLERWGEHLLVLAATDPFAHDAEIKLAEARSASNAINSYGEAGRWADLERWGERIACLAGSLLFTRDPAIQFKVAWGAVNAMHHYGVAQKWEDLERWGERLVALADNPRLPYDAIIGSAEAAGAFNAVLHYGNAGLRGSGREFTWRRRLALIAQAFPGDLQIQGMANTFDLSWVSQRSRAFEPFGRGPTINRRGESISA